MSRNLTNKTALVTGASKGIGAAIAADLAAHGATVLVHYSSDRQGADRTVSQIRSAGGRATPYQANLSHPDEITNLFSQIQQSHPRLDILVNNAGLYEFSPLSEITPDHFHKQFNLNVLGLLLTTQHAVRLFPPTGGSVINISSVASTATPPNASVYSATKAAVDAITKSLAIELGPRKIRVNAVNPGIVATEGTATAGITDPNSDFQKLYLSLTPLARIGQPQDIAPTVTFLASDDSPWTTAQTLYITGGFR